MPVVGDPGGGFYLAVEVFSLACHGFFGVGDAVEDDDLGVRGEFWHEEVVQWKRW